ncbi:MAG: hypothetical protein ACI9MC_002426 [Kiritimatiellia bacterium]|jgi:hypothetical protein
MRVVSLLWLGACTSGIPEDSGDPHGTDSGTETETETETTLVDIDEDGYDTSEDCDDFNPDIHPGAAELWNGDDDDCDGRVDADGHYEGTSTVQFRVVYEGRRHRWDLSCPAWLDRTGWQIDVQVRCERPADDALARKAMGEWFTFTESDNIADDGLWSGAVDVDSSDGWWVAGSGQLSWKGFDEASGTMRMRSTFVEIDATVPLSFKP